jgi:heme/copper-type cytochrome/quinol oxidase subunit 3
VRTRTVLDVSKLPLHGQGSVSVTWWGTLGFMLIEGSGFALVIGIYFYLWSLAAQWPLGAPPPGLRWSTWITVWLAASIVPNLLVSRWASRGELWKVRLGLVLMTFVGIVPLVLRWYEFKTLWVMWDSNAYGSIVWLLLGLHTTHLVTDLGDTIVLCALMFTRHGPNKRRLGDVCENSIYWNFVVAAWLPIYLCVYWLPRL